MIADAPGLVEGGPDHHPLQNPLQILTQNQPFRTAVPGAAQHNQLTIFAGIDSGVERVASDTYIAALQGVRARVSVFKQCIQHLAIPAAALFTASGFCGLLSWLLALLVSRGLAILRTLQSR
jgi:hypothetical protein